MRNLHMNGPFVKRMSEKSAHKTQASQKHPLCKRTCTSWNYCAAVTRMSPTPHHDYVIKWKHFPRYWSFVSGIHLSPVDSPHKGQWRRPLMFSLICPWTNGWANTRETGDLRRHRPHYNVTVMILTVWYKVYRNIENEETQFHTNLDLTLVNIHPAHISDCLNPCDFYSPMYYFFYSE